MSRRAAWRETDPRYISAGARRYDEWRRSHQGKYRFATRRQAWRAIASMCWRRRRPDVHLTPYTCQWGSDPAAGKRAGQPHLHVGHSKQCWPLVQAILDWRRALWYWRNRFLVWPYYRARRWVRARRKKG